MEKYIKNAYESLKEKIAELDKLEEREKETEKGVYETSNYAKEASL